MIAPTLLSKRRYHGLAEIWHTVSRSAFAELKYSYLRLLLCMIAMTVIFVAPLCGILLTMVGEGEGTLCNTAFFGGLLACAVMCFTYYPTIRYFSLPVVFVLPLPLIAILYLMMTITSAVRYTFGVRSCWKGRKYTRRD